MSTNDWLSNSDLLFHQIFMIFMAGLYVLAFIAGVTYKTMNIYCYFVFYPATFTLFLKSKKYILLATFLFFLIPNIQEHSGIFFDKCVDFLNYTAKVFHSNYIDMSIYLCVILPLALYIPIVIWKYDSKTLKKIAIGIAAFMTLYLCFIYPFFKSFLRYLMMNNSSIQHLNI